MADDRKAERGGTRPRATEDTAGVQAIHRAAQILTAVARRSESGIGLSELARRTELPHPTARRILLGLMQEHLVAQDPETRRYKLGPLIFELGLSAPQQSGLVRAARPVLEHLAAATGDTVYLVLRSGTDAICLDRIEGHFPIRVMTMNIGDRRPLGVGAAGLAMLAGLPETEFEAILREKKAEFAAYNFEQKDMRDAVMRTRVTGYGISQQVLTPGVSGVGMAIWSSRRTPIAGISIASVTDRILGPRLAELTALLREHVPTITV